MNIGIFVYNFPHKKTQEGILELFLNKYMPKCALAANPVKLDFYQSKIRIGPKGLEYIHPKKICDRIGVPYYVTEHSGEDCVAAIRDNELDLGIVLGARILKPEIIKEFKIGIINMHPGLLPENRGLDNIKWAVLDGLEQGVTSHFIDSAVDRGVLIDRKTVEVYEDDSLVDITLRVQNLELKMMVDALRRIESGEVFSEKLGVGKKNNSVSKNIEEVFPIVFDGYKKTYRRRLRED